MKVYADDRVIVLSRENLERLAFMLDHPDEHGESWCGKSTEGGFWMVRAEENEAHYEHRTKDRYGVH